MFVLGNNRNNKIKIKPQLVVGNIVHMSNSRNKDLASKETKAKAGFAFSNEN